MKVSTLLVAATLLGIALVAVPVDGITPVGTASAYVCEVDDAVEGAECLVEQTSACAGSTLEGRGCPR